MPDTLDGRFELIALHAFLVLHRVKSVASAKAFGQAMFDLMFADMDRSLREMGTGDLSVGKQVKRMATAFYGRVEAYQGALGEPRLLRGALGRNLFGTVEAVDTAHLDWFADYLMEQRRALAAAPLERIIAGHVAFAPLS